MTDDENEVARDIAELAKLDAEIAERETPKKTEAVSKRSGKPDVGTIAVCLPLEDAEYLKRWCSDNDRPQSAFAGQMVSWWVSQLKEIDEDEKKDVPPAWDTDDYDKLVVEIPRRVYYALKIRSIRNGTSMKKYIGRLFESLNIGNKREE